MCIIKRQIASNQLQFPLLLLLPAGKLTVCYKNAKKKQLKLPLAAAAA